MFLFYFKKSLTSYYTVLSKLCVICYVHNLLLCLRIPQGVPTSMYTTIQNFPNLNNPPILFKCLLLIMVCLFGEVTLHTMIVVSKLPLATCLEFGDQATQLTRALWKPQSCLCAN